ncbi:MAG: hypothetical protein GX292_02645 [Bacteroidales bacterium]|nr:hypothetical protein [Bacteroidales bacterium]
MKNFIYILSFLTLISFNSTSQKNNLDSLQVLKDSTNENKKSIQYTEQQLEMFLDSIGKLPLKPLMDKASFMTDSIF